MSWYLNKEEGEYRTRGRKKKEKEKRERGREKEDFVSVVWTRNPPCQLGRFSLLRFIFHSSTSPNNSMLVWKVLLWIFDCSFGSRIVVSLQLKLNREINLFSCIRWFLERCSIFDLIIIWCFAFPFDRSFSSFYMVWRILFVFEVIVMWSNGFIFFWLFFAPKLSIRFLWILTFCDSFYTFI